MLQTQKANLLDVVELTEDLPEYGLKKGERGTVVEVFAEPDVAYMVEFVDELGTSSRLADWVKPNQIKGAEEIAKEIFEKGIELFNQGDHVNAARVFQQAIKLMPSYLGVLHNSIVKSFEGLEEWQHGVTAMQFVLRVAPDYEHAKNNLAIAFQKYGLQEWNRGNSELALDLFSVALSIGPSVEISLDIQNSFSAVFSSLGIKEQEKGNLFEALRYMELANGYNPNETTRHNLGISFINFALDLMEKKNEGAANAFERAELAGIIKPEFLNDYGIALTLLGHFEKAIQAFYRALDLLPGSKIIKSNLKVLELRETVAAMTRVYDENKLPPTFEPILSKQPQFELAA